MTQKMQEPQEKHGSDVSCCVVVLAALAGPFLIPQVVEAMIEEREAFYLTYQHVPIQATLQQLLAAKAADPNLDAIELDLCYQAPVSTP